MKICSRHSIGVMLAMMIGDKVSRSCFRLEYKQLVLPGFDVLMGV